LPMSLTPRIGDELVHRQAVVQRTRRMPSLTKAVPLMLDEPTIKPVHRSKRPGQTNPKPFTIAEKTAAITVSRCATDEKISGTAAKIVGTLDTRAACETGWKTCAIEPRMCATDRRICGTDVKRSLTTWRMWRWSPQRSWITSGKPLLSSVRRF